MATENSEMEVDGIENDSKYKYSFVLGFSSKRMNFRFFQHYISTKFSCCSFNSLINQWIDEQVWQFIFFSLYEKKLFYVLFSYIISASRLENLENS